MLGCSSSCKNNKRLYSNSSFLFLFGTFFYHITCLQPCFEKLKFFLVEIKSSLGIQSTLEMGQI